ncbi:hypothetical protein BN1013_00356 [Candidatus Rubidus massiliensis]|nr:MAG: hypothetical protein BGO10_02625 [Chlamydia sp. 32-24]CDZ79856.1 hypothetical protein BN1013_00356 [Candidatus Rubidus massiliensis]
MFNNIPMKRLLTYVMILGLLPIILVFSYFWTKANKYTEIQDSFLVLADKALSKEKKHALNKIVHQTYREADHFYIDKHLETLDLLESEQETLQKILAKPSFTEDESTKKRLEYLQSSSNKLSFAEGVVQSYPFFQETAESLVHPVEVNAEDIQKILAHIEGKEIGLFKCAPKCPQLIITDFKIERKASQDKNEIFQLTMKLLKREYL